MQLVHSSLVIPSFNQVFSLGETLESVLRQGVPVEAIVIDGGSADGSVEIIRGYADHLTYWVSEPDRGQSHAINKGFERATGDVFGWLNSDDVWLPGALETLLELRRENPDAVVWAGGTQTIDREGNVLAYYPPVPNGDIGPTWNVKEVSHSLFFQPSALFSAEAFRQVGGLREDLHFAMDFDLWLKFSKLGRFATVDKPIAQARVYPEAKSSLGEIRQWVERIDVLFENGREKDAVAALRSFMTRQLRDGCRGKNSLSWLDEVPMKEMLHPVSVGRFLRYAWRRLLARSQGKG